MTALVKLFKNVLKISILKDGDGIIILDEVFTPYNLDEVKIDLVVT